MSYLRHISTRRLLALCAAVVAILAGSAAAIALATGGSGPTPPPKPLAQAVHDALAAAPVAGVTARITFTNHLIDGASLQGSGSAALRRQGPPLGRPATSSASSCRPRAPTAAPATCRSCSTATGSSVIETGVEHGLPGHAAARPTDTAR